MKNLKPFDLQEALSGKAVMLRNGAKAYVRHRETELDVSEHYKLAGYLSVGNALSWCTDGRYMDSDAQFDRDIVGMYPETRIINGFEVPAPETEAPDIGITCYAASYLSNKFLTELNGANPILAIYG